MPWNCKCGETGISDFSLKCPSCNGMKSATRVRTRKKKKKPLRLSPPPPPPPPSSSSLSSRQTIDKKMKISLFRGGNELKIVPFSSVADPKRLDGELPRKFQGTIAKICPKSLKPAFEFPPSTAYGNNDNVNGDSTAFRLKIVPSKSYTQELSLRLKVLDKNGNPIDKIAASFRSMDTATHKNGCTVGLKKHPSKNIWLSPYMRVSNTHPLKTDGRAIIHSLAPFGSRKLNAGLQFGRKLSVEVLHDDSVVKKVQFDMGGKPFAIVPVKFFLLTKSGSVTSSVENKIIDMVHQLNAWWAGQGIEFKLQNPSKPLTLAKNPSQTLISIGDFTGCRVVSNHSFTLTTDITVGKASRKYKFQVVTKVKANRDPSQVAGDIKTSFLAWKSPKVSGPASTIKLDAVIVQDLKNPRFIASMPATKSNGTISLKEIGKRGPVDIEIRPKKGIVLESLSIDKISVTSPSKNPDTTIDIHVPRVDYPFHEGITCPQSATVRHWVRTFSPPNKNFLSIIVEDGLSGLARLGRIKGTSGEYTDLCTKDLCSLYDANPGTMKSRFDPEVKKLGDSKAGAQAVLNFGLWGERPNFTLFIDLSQLSPQKNDLAHEVGHVLADLNHTEPNPNWCYKNFTMDSGTGKEDSVVMTNHEILVSMWANKFVKGKARMVAEMVAMKFGYGGAIRARIKTLQKGWCVGSIADGQAAWTMHRKS